MNHVSKQPTADAQAALKLLAKKCATWEEVMSAFQQGDNEVINAYRDLKDSMAAEQHCLCCYCEREIDGRSTECHIEHIKPRARFPKCTFNYDNLACSCNGRSGPDRHCGHLKGGEYDGRLFISPHNPLIANMFTYDIDGGIEASDPSRKLEGDHMIATLGLDCTRLVSMRRGHGKGLVATINGFLDFDDAVEFIDEFARDYVAPRDDGTLHPFVSLSRQIFAAQSRDRTEAGNEV